MAIYNTKSLHLYDKMNVVILSIGDELLSGHTINTNFSWIGRELSDIGCSIIHQATVPDNKSSISNNLNKACKNVTGFTNYHRGLGPTSDDITRNAIFESLSVSEKFDKKYWNHLKNKFYQMGTQISESNRSPGNGS